jgi:predicted nucleotidyltransferase component of viral defense system
MIINKEVHKRRMLKILADISANPLLSVNLGFKGGTCCYFIHGLDRFSVDLDFDLLSQDKQAVVLAELDSVLSGYGELKMEGKVFCRKLKYDDESATLKIDISDRFDINKLNTYRAVDIVSGIPLNVLAKEDIFAHKLVALTERYNNKIKNKIIANRDLYDINYFFDLGWSYNKKIIELRSRKSCVVYLSDMKSVIAKTVNEKNILEGLGELVDNKKRDWIKTNLKNEVLKKISIEISVLEEK